MRCGWRGWRGDGEPDDAAGRKRGEAGQVLARAFGRAQAASGLGRSEAAARLAGRGCPEGLDCRPECAQNAESFRDEELTVGETESATDGPDHAGIGGHSPDEGHGRLDRFPLGHGGLEVAGDRLAQPAEDSGRLHAALLGVDHIAFGEDRAPAGDAGGMGGRIRDRADLIDLVEQAGGLLIDERAGAGRALAVACVIHDAGRAAVRVGLERDELRGVASDLEDRPGLWMKRADTGRESREVV